MALGHGARQAEPAIVLPASGMNGMEGHALLAHEGDGRI